jgi:hypothetical protein
MLPVGVWRRELLELRVRRGALLFGAALPLAAALPLLGGNPPAFHAAAVYTTLVVLTGAVASGRRAATLLSGGILTRLLATPARPSRLFVEALLAQVALNFLRVLPLLLAIGVRHHTAPGVFAGLLLSALPALLLAVLVGVAAGVVSHTRGEVPLYAFVALLPGLFLCGAFTPTGLASPAHDALAWLLPFTSLHHAMLAATFGLPAVAEDPPAWVGWLAAAAWLGVGTLLLQRRLRRLA